MHKAFFSKKSLISSEKIFLQEIFFYLESEYRTHSDEIVNIIFHLWMDLLLKKEGAVSYMHMAYMDVIIYIHTHGYICR
jgi:hypothetical protein